eukprot:m.17557 g.17557  ORF g.17557 m.17557 type:complete len:200 (-) comp10674_c0_seq1:250-849(-)
MSDFDFNLLTSRPPAAVQSAAPAKAAKPADPKPKAKQAKIKQSQLSRKQATIVTRDREHRKAALIRLQRKKDNFRQRLVKKAQCSYDKQPVTVENSRLTWTFNLQPYPRSFGGQGFAKESAFVNLKDPSFEHKFQALWDEHLAGFHRKAFTKARKKEFQRDMLWKEQLMASEQSSQPSATKRSKGPKGPARVGKKKRKR